jgi:hypothetical protein
LRCQLIHDQQLSLISIYPAGVERCMVILFSLDPDPTFTMDSKLVLNPWVCGESYRVDVVTASTHG